MPYTAAVITVSDKGFRGERVDTSGPMLRALLEANGFSILHHALVPDEPAQIQTALRHCADSLHAQLILTTGGTGFSPRDRTPEAAMALIERPTPGLAERMRSESMKITPRGCLSRAVAGIRGQSLILTLPGSEKAARENLTAVLPALPHGLDMLASAGSADCAAAPSVPSAPSLDQWLREAKAAPDAARCGMYLTHCGVVRATAKASAREGVVCPPVCGMRFDYDDRKLAAAIARARALPGIFYVRAWLARGDLRVGDDLMRVLVGGDIRPHVVDALQSLVGELKTACVSETELFKEESL